MSQKKVKSIQLGRPPGLAKKLALAEHADKIDHYLASQSTAAELSRQRR